MDIVYYYIEPNGVMKIERFEGLDDPIRLS